MARFRIDSLADLARQMAFTPHAAREAQLQSAEELLHSLDPLKAYPIEYVVFRITGYHPKSIDQNLLTGLALQHDLGQLIETVSDSLDLRVDQSREPVLQIEDVCERFNVTSKTIQRWRRKGFVARRFIFPDGKRRVGFLLSGVERFLSSHQDQVTRGANFSQVSAAERDEIVRRARQMSHQCGCCPNEISRRVARRVNRSPLTVQHIIKKHDAENPQQAVFIAGPAPMGAEERIRIARGFRSGVGLKALARKWCRSKTSVYRAIIDERLDRLLRRKAKFIDDTLYHQDNAENVIDQIVAQQPLAGDFDREKARVPRDLPAYLAELYRTPLLAAGRERALFLKFNFHKWQFIAARRRVEPHRVMARDLKRIEGLLRRAIDAKNAIVRANLRLVVSVARKHMRPGLSLMELVSDGNITLMRAVESFDIHRGYRFSTYASLALMKGFARSVPLMLAGRAVQPAGEHALAEVTDRRGPVDVDRIADRDQLRKLLAVLEPHERQVLLAHYGIVEAGIGAHPKVSPRQAKQIQRKAIDKIRAAMDISAA